MKLIAIGSGLMACLVTAVPAAAGPIHEAARLGELKSVSALLATDRNLLDAKDATGHTPLTLSAAYGQWELFRFLLEAGADTEVVTKASTTPLHVLCHHDRPDMAALLLEYGCASCVTVRDVYGEYTPLLRAVQSGNGRMIEFLLRNGAQPDESTREGWNALHLAAICGHRHLYGPLIAAGVSLDAEDRVGRTPMSYDRKRPAPVPMDSGLFQDYVGSFHWQADPNGPGVDVFLADGRLILDDNGLNKLYPVGQDAFYCTQNPWRVTFLRSDDGRVDRVELIFIRQTVVLDKVEM